MKGKNDDYPKFTIMIDMPINDIKDAYRRHFGIKGRVAKKDLSRFFAALVVGDLEAILCHENDSSY